MLRAVNRVYNGYIGNNSSVKYYTSSHWNAVLGHWDEFGLQVVVDDVSSVALVNFDLFVDHSGNGKDWIPARKTPDQNAANFWTGNGDVHFQVQKGDRKTGAFTIPCRGVTNGNTSLQGGPLLAFVRLNMNLASGTARVSVHAFGRNYD